MKKIYNVIMLLAIALTGLSLTACSEDDLDTNQYKGGVSLSAYGPQPVMRGGTLRFLGSNLDQIAQVKIPGIDPITNIEVIKSGNPSEIRVVLPKDGPEPGYVTLVSKTDQEITTKTELTYEEPIEITSFTPASVMPGETIAIEGDYLNLVQMVQFANDDENVYVGQNDFIEHTRYKIVVTVPEQARSGKLNLYTLDLTDENNDADAVTYNILETEDALTVGTPTVSKFASPRGEAEPQGTVTAKMGEKITITGEHFGLVDAVAFGDAGEDGKGTVVTVELKDLAISEDGKTIELTLPEAAPDGDVNLVARSGVEIPVGLLETVAPSECVAAPSPVKAGNALTITGKDLDVVNSIEMPNVTDAIEFTKEADGTKLTITSVPELAQEGNLTLRMLNGKGVEVAYTLVKPVVTGYDNATVNAGAALTLKGTDLDLVKSVDFGGAVVEDITVSDDGTSISLTVPMEAKSGKPTLNVKNGTTVDAPELTVAEAVFCYVVAFPDEENTPEAGSTMTVEVKNGDKLTNVYVNGEEVKFVYDSKNSKLTVGIPQKASSTSVLKLVSSNGEIEQEFSVIPAGKVTTVIWTGPVDLSGWGKTIELPANSFADIPDGAAVTLVIDYTVTGSDPKIKWYNGHWENIAMPGSEGSENIVALDANATSLEMALSSANLANLQKYNDWGYCGLFHGQDAIINKVSIVYTVSMEININSDCVSQGDQSVAWTFPSKLTWDDTGRFRILRNGANDLQSQKWTAGTSVLRIYKSGTGQAQINDGNWSSFLTLADWNGDVDVLETTLTQDMCDWLTGAKSDGWSNSAFIIQGDGMTITKITLEP